MGRATDESIQVVVCNAEVNIDPVKHILRQILKDVLSHFDVDVTFSLVSIGPLADLDSSRVEGSIRVLVTRD